MIRRALITISIVLAQLGSSVIWARPFDTNNFFDTTLQASLAEAAADGRTERLDVLLAQGADVNARGRDGMTATLWAVRERSKTGLVWLLEHGANPNVIFARDGNSAIEVAARLEDPEFLKAVLAHGGDVNIQNPLSLRTPISDALASGHKENVRLLIAAGANMNLLDRNGGTPLVGAAANQKYDLVYEMLQAGADPTVKTAWRGVTILSVIRQSTVLPTAPSYEWKMKVIELLKQKGLDVENGK